MFRLVNPVRFQPFRRFNHGLLHDVKVLDLSRVLAGPWASQLLADFGADVVKIENPKRGDDTRQWGPPFLENKPSKPSQPESSYFLSTNRGKKSVCIDISTEKGQKLIHQLIKDGAFDVIIENFKVGGLAKYNLDYESLKKIKQDIIYCSITGFGQTGSKAEEPGYDFMAQGLGGLMSITGPREGPPLKVGVAVVDITTGMYAATAILAALHSRRNNGEGKHIDIALLHVSIAMLGHRAQDHLIDSQIPIRYGNDHPTIVPYCTFRTSDNGHIIIGVGNDSQFRQLCNILDLTELGTSEQFATNPLRVKNRIQLVDLLQTKFQLFTREYWLEKLKGEKIPFAPINDIKTVFQDPETFQDMTLQMSHPANSDGVTLIANPIKVDGESIRAELAPPLLGQHTKEVLQSYLGLDLNQIQQLENENIVSILK